MTQTEPVISDLATAGGLSGYRGPVIDTFLHTPWLGGDDLSDPRGDRVDWHGDARLKRVMRTFSHVAADGQAMDNLSLSQIVDQMDEAGTERALLPAKVYYRADAAGVRGVHREIGLLTGASEGRLRGVATIVPPELGPATYWDVMQNVRIVQEAYELYGVVGVHLTPAPWGLPPNHKWFFPVYAKCVELGLAVFIHVGMPGPLWPMENQHPGHLEEIALAFPDLVLVAHHIGDPWTDISVRLAAHHDNVYICTSAWSPKRYPDELMQFMAGRWHQTLGCKKVLFASDFPLLDMQRATRDARALPLAADALRDVLYENARRLFWPA